MRWLPGSLATPTRQRGSGARLNTSNPLTRGLRAALVPVPGGLWDAVGGVLLRPAGSSTVAAPSGVAISTPVGGNTGISLGRAIPLPGNALTVITVTTQRDQRGLGTGTGFLYDGNASSGTGRYLIYRRGFGGTAQATSYGLYAGGTAIQEGDTGLVGLLTFGQRNTIAAVHAGNSHAIYKDGRLLQSWTVSVTYGAFTPTILGNWALSTTEGYGGETELQLYFDRALSADEVRLVSANPWQLFTSVPQPMWAPAISAVTIFRPNSDIAVSGWVGTPSSNLFENIDEATLSRTDYITSPDVSTPATFGLTASMVAGVYTVRIDANKTGTTGQIRVRFLNSSSVDVGGSSWQSLTTSATTYTLSATLTGTADRIKIEVQA